MPEIEHAGVRIHFEDTGEGLPIVLGHSFLCSGEMWANQVPHLATDYRVINVDLRGHGMSGPFEGPCDLEDLVADVSAVLDHLQIDQAVWAGLSIGGMVAMRAALAAPDRVRALILADTHAGAESATKIIRYRAMSLVSRVLGVRPLVQAVSRFMFGTTTLRSNPQLVAGWQEKFAAVHVPSINRVLNALVRRRSVLDELWRLRCPTLVLVGAEDASLPVELSREIADAIPQASLVILDRAGHLSALEQPEAVTWAMREFLQQLD